MPEWVRQTVDGKIVAVKTTDAMLEWGTTLLTTISALEMELAEYRTIVPTSEVNPAHV